LVSIIIIAEELVSEFESPFVPKRTSFIYFKIHGEIREAIEYDSLTGKETKISYPCD
jgi:hypothetical protein